MKKISSLALSLMFMSNYNAQAQDFDAHFPNNEKIAVFNDTVYFNARAYLTCEGAMFDRLLTSLPAIKFFDYSSIVCNGKTISKILLNGQEFFFDDISTAIRNLPADYIDYIKFYERQSDMARATGVDDLEQEYVLDIQYRQEILDAISGTLNGALGTRHRYDGNINLDYLKEGNRITISGAADNTGMQKVLLPRYASGLSANKQASLDFFTYTDKLEIGGGGIFSYNGSDNRSQTSSQNLVLNSYTGKETQSFGEGLSQSYSSNIGVNSNFRIEWKPTDATQFLIRPNYRYQKNRGSSYSQNYSYNQDPYSEQYNPKKYKPFDEIDSMIAYIDSIVVHTNLQRQQTASWSSQFGGSIQATHKFGTDGRNLALRVNGSVKNGGEQQLSAADISFYSTPAPSQINNRYYNTPTKSANISAQLQYTEPIAYKTYLQIGYTFGYNYSKNDKQAYICESTKNACEDLRQALFVNRYDIDAILDYMNSVNYALQNSEYLSQYSEYKTYQHTASLSLRKVTDYVNFSIGVDLVPIATQLDYKKSGKSYFVKKNQFNYAPRIDFRYQFNKTTQLRANYSGRMSQPSLQNLIDIKDDSNPLNITIGNPDLKPSFAHNLRVNFNSINRETSNSFFGNANGSFTQNSMSNITSYDAESGVRTTQTANINGNWNLGFGGGFNLVLDPAWQYFNLGNFLNVNYSNYVAYYAIGNGTNLKNVKGTTKNWAFMDNLDFSYRRDYFEIALTGSVNYTTSKNDITSQGSQNTWNFSYGAELHYKTPWGTSISTDIAMSSRRGYANDDANTDELLWNAQLAQSLFKNSLTIALEAYDILGERSNISRIISATQRSEFHINNIYQYGAVRIIYNFSVSSIGIARFMKHLK